MNGIQIGLEAMEFVTQFPDFATCYSLCIYVMVIFVTWQSIPKPQRRRLCCSRRQTKNEEDFSSAALILPLMLFKKLKTKASQVGRGVTQETAIFSLKI